MFSVNSGRIEGPNGRGSFCRKVFLSPLAGRPYAERIRDKNSMTPTDPLKAASAASTGKRSGIRAQIYSLKGRLIKDKPFCIICLPWSLNSFAVVAAKVDDGRRRNLFFGETGLWFGLFRDYRRL